jgi:glutamyl-Q tRNA(Asp) synthetase
MPAIITRFAPSPTGYLHLGHAASAIAAYAFARAHNGKFILRIEDIDQSRCRANFVEAIYEDLAWLGLTWDMPVRVQSQHFADYQTALDKLRAQGLLYPCFCTRSDIAAATTAPHGPEGRLYPGTCKYLEGSAARIGAGEPHAWRLHVDRAQALTGPLRWQDAHSGHMDANPASLGDVVLARKDAPTSYHLAVTVDDALQGITHVVRGSDLFHATHMHRLLQALLDLPTPAYQHHALLIGPDGKRLSKRDASLSLHDLRRSGVSAADIRKQIATASRDAMPLV